MNANVLGLISVAIGALAYALYYRGIFSKTNPTRPHIFTWLAWTIAIGFVFFAQVKESAGAGAWATGFTGINCLIITIIAFFRGEKDIKWTDWICLFSSIAGIMYWKVTSGFIVPIIILSLADVVAFIPTYRKDYLKPDEDTASAFLLNALKFGVALLAIDSWSIATYFYPATLMLDNLLCSAIILFRRRYLFSKKSRR
jgi:hypothetical protein